MLTLMVCVAGSYAVEPDALSGLAFWVKADAGITTNANGVSGWADQSGAGHDASVETGKEPTFISSVSELDGKPTLRFDGTERMKILGDILPDGVESFTIIAMARVKTGSAGGPIMGFRTAGEFPLVYLDITLDSPRFIVMNGPPTTAANATASSVTGTGFYGMFGGRLTKNNATAWTSEVFLNSATALTSSTTATADFSAYPNLTSGDRYIGAWASGYFTGAISEIIIYNRALSDSEMSDVWGYMKSRYHNDIPAVEEVAGLAAWFRADSGVSQSDLVYGFIDATNGAAADLWLDSSSGMKDAFNSWDAGPTYKINIVGGLPATEFVATAQNVFNLTTPIATNISQMTVFAVLSHPSAAAGYNMVFTHRDKAVPLIQTFVNGSDAGMWIRDDDGIPGIAILGAGGMHTDGTFNIVMYQVDTVNNLHAVSVNGGSEDQDTSDFDSITADTQRIGYVYEGIVDEAPVMKYFFDGHIAELIVYEGVVLTAVQKRKIGVYLEEKYDLDTAYAPFGAVIMLR